MRAFLYSKGDSSDLGHNLDLLSIRMLHAGGKERHSTGCPHREKASREGLLVGWIKLVQGRVGALYRERAQVGHKAGSHQYITRDVVEHVLQILHSLLPANLLI